MTYKMVELERESCMGCGKEATYAYIVDEMLKGLYCAECAGRIEKNIPENVDAHKTRGAKGTASKQQVLKEVLSRARLEKAKIESKPKPEGVKK